MKICTVILLSLISICLSRPNEYIPLKRPLGSIPFGNDDTVAEVLPESFSWDSVNGTSYLTPVRNQHSPQYCGSCWAFGSLSALADRIKIARKAQGTDILLSPQFILNCGNAGSCHGGDHLAVYEFIKKIGYVPYDTCQPYIACSKESKEGFCSHTDTTCSPINTCKTCGTFTENGGTCRAITHFPNATIDDFGSVSGVSAMKSEIYKRGPISCSLNANILETYHSGIINRPFIPRIPNHVVSVVGWGLEKDHGNGLEKDLEKDHGNGNGTSYWIVRNSWGYQWGLMGFFKIVMGSNQLGIESDCAWATVGSFTDHDGMPSNEDGSP
jgi:cathepsin X